MDKVLKSLAGSNKTAISIGDIKIPCYVLEDETRVLSGNGLQRALGFSQNAGGTALSTMLNTGELKDCVTQEIVDKINNRKKFIRPGGAGAVSETYGYDATLLIDICALLDECKDLGLLTPGQQKYADQAGIILRSIAKVGIIALIDEATGYQAYRQEDELQKFLQQYISKELSAWVRRFPPEYYQEIYRLYGWNYDEYNTKRPGVIGKITNNIIYDRLAPYIRKELEKINPKNESGNRSNKHHQYLTQDIGHPALSQHMHLVINFMKVSNSWDDFINMLDKAKPKYTPQMLMNLDL